MRCSICEKPCGYGATSITVILDMQETVNLCNRCRGQLLGAEVNNRLVRLLGLKAWVQPVLPGMPNLSLVPDTR